MVDSMVPAYPDGLSADGDAAALVRLSDVEVPGLFLILPQCDESIELRGFLVREGFATQSDTLPSTLHRHVGADRIGLIVLDVSDPSIDGIAVLRALRETSSVPVVAVADSTGSRKAD